MPPTYLIAHPEARIALEHLTERTGVTAQGTFEPVGLTWTPAMNVRRELPAEPFIVLNGSGNFHHETLVTVESLLANREGEIAYVQIDAHPDTRPMFRWVVDCSSFVGRLLENRRIRSVHILGQYPECITEPNQPGPMNDKLGYYRCDYFGKFHQYISGPTTCAERYFPHDPTWEQSAKNNPSIRKVRKTKAKLPGQDRTTPGFIIDWHTLDAFDAANLPDLPVFLSIDLDVAIDRPVTDWRRKAAEAEGKLTPNQGNIPFARVLELVRQIGSQRTLMGADICGLVERTTWLPPETLEDSLEAVRETYEAIAKAMKV